MLGAGVSLIGATLGRRPDTDKYLTRTSWGMAWDRASQARASVSSPWQSSTQLRAGVAMPWTDGGDYVHPSWSLGWARRPDHRVTARIRWADFAHQPRPIFTFPWERFLQRRREAGFPWNRFTTVHRGWAFYWLTPPTRRRGYELDWARGPGERPTWWIPWLAPPQVRDGWSFPWGRGDGLPWLVEPEEAPEPPPVEPPIYDVPPADFVGLDLACPLAWVPGDYVELRFGPFACYASREQRRVIVVLNTINVYRLPDYIPIRATAVELHTDVDSWAWSVRIALETREDLDLVKPTPAGQRRVRIEINGYAWHAMIEGLDDDRAFTSFGASVRGRSETARLAAPYALARSKETTFDRLAQQLVDEELTNTGFTADYQAVDWLVPAGAWHYQELTPIDAISRVARASGAVVQSHASDDQLIIAPRFPVSPWDWTSTAPDKTIVDDLIDSMRLQVQSKPLYDAVFVAGELEGVSARVKRSGSAAETYAPMVVDPLITHADAARERGRNILGDRGELARVEVDLPLFATPLAAGQPGLVLPLQLVDVAEASETWRAQVVGTGIRAIRQGKELEVAQTVTVERHYSDAN